MRLFQESASSALSLINDSYIYSIVTLGPQSPNSLEFASISSDDSLTLFLVSKTSITVEAKKTNAHRGISCLTSLDLARKAIVTAGRDGFVRIWNTHTHTVTKELRTPHNEAISALAVNLNQHLIAVGTELESQGPGDVAIYVWDLWSSSPSPHRQYTESHTDTITRLHFSPDHQSPLLLSSSTDGLINFIDTTIADEDDAISTVLNNKSAVHHVDFINPHQVCAISQDELLAFYSLEDSASAAPSDLYDLRDKFGCDCAISLVRQPSRETQGLVLALGANKSETVSTPNVTIYTLSADATYTTHTFSPAIRLQGGHGEEVVRDVWFQDNCPFILTCGEDGYIRAWWDPHADGAEDGETEASKGKKGRKKREGHAGGGRFAPY